MTHTLPIAALVLGLSLAAPMAAATESCAEQAAAIRSAQTAALELKADRDALSRRVEEAGETWQNAQTVRNFSAEDAARADEARADYDQLKADLGALDAELQRKASRTNAQVTAYNSHCASDG